MFAAMLALIFANTPLQSYYALFLDTPLEIRIGPFGIAKPLLLWINDGLMAVFFFLVGLELKRELIEGELSDKRNIILPGIGAVGGMLVPALIYVYFKTGDPSALKGWAIPAATDIAFALGVLSLLGSKVPFSIKIFLTSLAIFDDIGAILIIAIFYTAKISFTSLAVVAFCIPVLAWSSLYGTAALCGIGFTMSLFIGSLAFEETGINLMFDERLGIILGSFASGIIGYMLLRASLSSNNRINSD